jgi:hypothetical protein
LAENFGFAGMTLWQEQLSPALQKPESPREDKSALLRQLFRNSILSSTNE